MKKFHDYRKATLPLILLVSFVLVFSGLAVSFSGFQEDEQSIASIVLKQQQCSTTSAPAKKIGAPALFAIVSCYLPQAQTCFTVNGPSGAQRTTSSLFVKNYPSRAPPADHIVL